MDYVKEMRAHIGHAPLLLVGAAVLVMDEGRLLMMRRSDNHTWGIPGGALEPGEHLEETAQRETREETGPELYYRYPNGDEVYNVSAVYFAGEVKGEICLNREEHSEHRYFDLQDLPQDVSQPIRVVLERLQKSVQSFKSSGE